MLVIIVIAVIGTATWFILDFYKPSLDKILYYRSQQAKTEPAIISINNDSKDNPPSSILVDDNCYCITKNINDEEKKSSILTEEWKKDKDNKCQCENAQIPGSNGNTGGNIATASEENACISNPYSVTYKITTMGATMNLTLACRGELKRCDYQVEGESVAATEYMINDKLTMCTNNSGEEMICITGLKNSGCKTYFDRFLSSDLNLPGADAHVNEKYYIAKNIAPIESKTFLNSTTKCYPFADSSLSNQQEACFNSNGVLFYSGTKDGSIINMIATKYQENISDSMFTIPNVKTFDQSAMPGL